MKNIKELLTKTLEAAYNAPLNYTPKPNMKLSFLGTPCLRKIYYSYLRVPYQDPWIFERIKNFEKGNSLHDMVKEWLRRSGVLIDNLTKKGKIPISFINGKPDPEFPVSSVDLSIKNNRIDGVGFVQGVEGVKDGLWVFEIKTINKKGFNNYIKTGPKKEHLHQAMPYVFLFEDELAAGRYDHIPKLMDLGLKEINGVIFIYLNRESDENDIKEFVVPKDSKPFLEVVEKILKTKEYIASKELPPKTEDFCDWCPFKKKCDLDYKVI